MNASKLTDYQLYEIMHNDQLLRDIKKLAIEEFSKRRLSTDQLLQIVKRHEKQFKRDTGSLHIKYKLLIMAFPFFVPIHGIIATRLIPYGQKTKTKEYWFYISLGYLFWTMIVILFGRYVLFRAIAEAGIEF